MCDMCLALESLSNYNRLSVNDEMFGALITFLSSFYSSKIRASFCCVLISISASRK